MCGELRAARGGGHQPPKLVLLRRRNRSRTKPSLWRNNLGAAPNPPCGVQWVGECGGIAFVALAHHIIVIYRFSLSFNVFHSFRWFWDLLKGFGRNWEGFGGVVRS